MQTGKRPCVKLRLAPLNTHICLPVNISDAINPVHMATYTFSCVSGGSHTCHRRTSEDGRLWPHNDGTRCASCSGAYRKMMFPLSEEQDNSYRSGPTSNLVCITLVQCISLTVLSQYIKMNHSNSYVRTFMINITDKTCHSHLVQDERSRLYTNSFPLRK